MKRNKIIDIEIFQRLPKPARICRIREYPIKALRITKSGVIEMKVRGWDKRQVWIAIDRCIKERYTEEELESIRYGIEAKNE